MKEDVLKHICKLECFDVEDIVLRFQGCPEVFLPILLRFEASLRPSVEKLTLLQQNPEELIKELHSLKGALGNLGALSLSLLAQKMENLARENKEFSTSLYGSFFNEFEKASEEVRLLPSWQELSLVIMPYTDLEFLQKIKLMLQSMEMISIEYQTEIQTRFKSSFAQEVSVVLKGIESFEYKEAEEGLQKIQEHYS